MIPRNIDRQTLERITEENLGKKLIGFSLKGQGMCNNVWYAVSEDHQQYSVKQERSEKEEDEQNDLLVEARIIRRLNEKSPSLPVPHVVFLAENPKMYCYHYVEGERMRDAWDFLSAAEKFPSVKSWGNFMLNWEKP
jgi:aminoglycoside phosphotransferase (APT) family kinase protein